MGLHEGTLSRLLAAGAWNCLGGNVASVASEDRGAEWREKPPENHGRARQRGSYIYISRAMIPERRTRTIRIGPLSIGGASPIAVQSMAATRTQDLDATMGQIERIHAAGADLIRVAVDSPKDAEALAELSRRMVAKGIDVPLSLIHISEPPRPY